MSEWNKGFISGLNSAAFSIIIVAVLLDGIIHHEYYMMGSEIGLALGILTWSFVMKRNSK